MEHQKEQNTEIPLAEYLQNRDTFFQSVLYGDLRDLMRTALATRGYSNKSADSYFDQVLGATIESANTQWEQSTAPTPSIRAALGQVKIPLSPKD